MFNSVLTKISCLRLGTSMSRIRFTVLKREFTNSETASDLGVSYKPDFTDEQQIYLLQILNESSPEQLSRFNLSKSRIKKIYAWRSKHGQFNSLTDVLDVDGLGVKLLNRLCKIIIEAEIDTTKTKKEKPIKTRGQMITPALLPTQTKELRSALSIHLYATGLSWARIERENNFLSHWDLNDYNLSSKKLTPTDALQLMINVAQEIPPSEVYIFETPIAVTPTAQQSSISVAAYAQRVQLLSMLMTILSTSPIHNPAYRERTNNEKINDDLFILDPIVFFLRHRLSARLFRTLVGTERVSAATTVAGILSNNSHKSLNYTPILVNSELNSMYEMEIPVNKEVLGQALLLAMSFMDICIHQNPKSIKAISSNKQ